MNKDFIHKIINIQKKLRVPKNQFNKFGGYYYRSAEDILEAVKPLVNEQGLILTINDTIINENGRYYVKATANITDGVDNLSVSAYAREEETKEGADASQITGSASSYARKYALNGLFCIDDTKDADATNTHGKDQPQEEEMNLSVILERVNASKTYDELKALWDNFGKFDKDKKLYNAIAHRNKQISNSNL